MSEDDEAFEAFVRGIRPRSVLEVEQERTAKGYPPDAALLKHGGAIEDEIQRTLEREAETQRSAHGSAEILSFPSI